MLGTFLSGAHDGLQETFVQRNQHRIYVREYPGEEPTIILMHGLPDNLHLYNRLLPYLSPPRRVVAFDFLGRGSSDKPSGYPYAACMKLQFPPRSNLPRQRQAARLTIKSVTWKPSSLN